MDIWVGKGALPQTYVRLEVRFLFDKKKNMEAGEVKKKALASWLKILILHIIGRVCKKKACITHTQCVNIY